MPNYSRGYGPFIITTAPVNGTSETQTITASGTAASGGFKATFMGQTTASLAFNVTAVDFTTALEGLATVGTTGASVTSASVGKAYYVAFGGNLTRMDLSPITIATTTVDSSGSTVNWIVSTCVAGVDATLRGAPTGAIAICTLSSCPTMYQNTGSPLAPTWKEFGKNA